MKTFTKFSLRFAVYLVVFAYILCDLFVFDGPLSHKLSPPPVSMEDLRKEGVVAQVYGHYIDSEQLDRAVAERLWLEGKSEADISPANLKLIRYAALGELIDHEILRTKVKVSSHQLLVSDEEINARLKRFTEGFSSATELREAMQSQGIKDELHLRNWIASRMQQEKFVASRIAKLAEVSAKEIEKFYAKNKKNLRRPERIRARHIFIPTLGTPSQIAREQLAKTLLQLEAKEKTFAELAASVSQDPATKSLGGDLGWMSARRLPEDFSKQVFALKIGNPTLIQTKIGWHLIEATDRKPAEDRTLDELREEIAADLNSAKRDEAAKSFRDALRKHKPDKIKIFHDHLNY